MDVYLDNHSTTPCDPRVVDAMLPWFTEQPGNAASRSHKWGYAARSATEHARGQLAERLGCSPKELVFTSGATESDNLAVLGVLRANRDRGDHLITVATEHKAVLDAARQAEAEGFRVTVLPCNPDGTVALQRISEAITDRTVLVSVMWANNEVGTLQPMAEITALCHERGVWVHTDAAQALGSCDLDLGAVPVDLMSLSAHKAYGPKGVGALFVRRTRPRVKIEPLQYGGGHERGIRSGTLPVPLIVGFGVAASLFDPDEVKRIAGLRDQLREGLLAVGGVEVNGSENRLAGNLHVYIEGVEAEALMMGCRSIAMSSGSACTSATLAPSHVLRAMGLDPDRAAGSIRFGLGRFNTEAQIEFAVQQLGAKITELRAMAHLYEV